MSWRRVLSCQRSQFIPTAVRFLHLKSKNWRIYILAVVTQNPKVPVFEDSCERPLANGDRDRLRGPSILD